MWFVNAALALAAAAFFAVAGVLLFFAGSLAFEFASLGLMIALPVALGIVSVAALRLGPAFRINLFLVLASITVAIFGTDAAMQFGWLDRAPAPDRARADRRDTRTVQQVVAALRKKGRTAFPAVFPRAQFVHRGGGSVPVLGDMLALGGVSKVATVYCNESGRYLVYPSGERGFHNPRGIWGRGDIDIVAVGDSFVHGACVDSDKNFMALIRHRRDRTVSLGIASNGPLMMLATLREYLPVLRPKVILWFYFEENDINTDLPIERRMGLLMRYLEPGFSQRLATRQSEIDRRLAGWLDGMADKAPDAMNPPPRFGQIGRLNLADLVLLRTLRNRLHIGMGPKDADLELFDRVMAQAKSLAREGNAKLLLVYLPGKRRFTGLIGRQFQNLARHRVLQRLSRLEIPVIDLLPAFAAHRDPIALFRGHYTEEGNRLVAATILEALNALGDGAGGVLPSDRQR
jgi:hypothetical protein